ncbi:SOS response-associated peptidase [Rubrimonas sp.]|uniref:SOS response-associated peptidase n=1 Tax=Rubrimonas sp. TaxID=2036015 RepID=UPI002FDE1BC2
MCGRFALTLPRDAVRAHFSAAPTEAAAALPDAPRYNICPTQPVAAIRLDAEGRRALDALRWGFIPPWAKTPSDGPLLINARAETLHEKPAFREACRRTRCLIPATGFFEWRADAGRGKEPWFIRPAQADLMAFAGVWTVWSGPDGPVASCAIVTCAANAALAPIHHRMPVIVPPADYGLWLGEEGKGAATLMKPAPEGFLAMHRVDRAVNAARHDAPELIEPIDAEA